MKEQERLMRALRLLAPGTPLREGLDNILRAKTGAVIVLDDSTQALELVEGGFDINCEFRPSYLYELAKMDGAIVMSRDGQRILKANAHLMPPPHIPSQETGIRHRIAERMARHTGALVVAISQRRSLITLYFGNNRYLLKDTAFILNKANQAAQTLGKYRTVLDRALNNLSALEFEDVVTLHEVLKVLQRAEMVQRIREEMELYICQLGTEGRLVDMQLEELAGGVAEEELAVIRDYLPPGDRSPDQVVRSLRALSGEELLELTPIGRVLGLGGAVLSTEQPLVPRGYRLLQKVPRLPGQVVENLVKAFGSLPAVLNASLEQLDAVEGIGEVRARYIKEGLKRLREQVLIDRHF